MGARRCASSSGAPVDRRILLTGASAQTRRPRRIEDPTIETAAPPRPDAGIEFISGLDQIASRYHTIFCDVWGVLHDGLTAFPEASDALVAFRDGGGRVILVTNAPRPGFVVTRQLDRLGVSPQAYDTIVSSGDLTRFLVARRQGETAYWIGPERDVRLFDGLDLRFGELDLADYVICTGLVDDERETAADYTGTLRRMKERDLPMICANPDLVVERGGRLIPCAGALAAAYEELGGRAVTAGKPHRPIYEAAVAASERVLGREPDPAGILAIGDAMRTDVAGARAFGLDVLMTARGIHSDVLGVTGETFDHAVALDWLSRQAARPTAMITKLAWAS